jgi:endonuclease/exonuclease/phosphatase family metal-dependent hydrolase
MSWIEKNKKRPLMVGGTFLILVVFYLLFLWTLGGPALENLAVDKNPGARAQVAQSFKVMTLNLAHGRLDGAHQVFLNRAEIEQNLHKVSALMDREQAVITAVQEADDQSWWSGGFNHVTCLSEKSRILNSVQGHHVQGIGLQYGTALLSRVPLTEAKSYTFPFSPPTFPKGFVMAQAELGSGRFVDVVSIHLDFLVPRSRRQQADHLLDILSKRTGAKILMGDFNAEWEKEGILQRLTEKLNLKAYKVESKDIVTFPGFSKRIDWILVSSDFEFVSHKVLPDTISDHRAVLVELRDLRVKK